MRRVTDDERRRRLAVRHLLTPAHRLDRVEEVADAVIALHSSDPVTVHLGACARLADGAIESVERALYDDRTLVRHHAMRRTLWVTTVPNAEMAHAACTRRIARAERIRTLRLLGRDERWLDDAIGRVVTVVAAAGRPMGTRELGRLLPDLAVPVVVRPGTRGETTMAPHTRVALHAAFEGALVRTRPAGSWIGSQYAWMATASWTAIDWAAHDEDGAAAALVAAWLRRFGPGTLDDIVWWSGATKRAVRSALAVIGAEPVALDGGLEGAVAADDELETGDPGPWVALLPGLDPTSMGWKHRRWYVDSAIASRVTDRNGNIGPTVWIDGRIVGGWVQRPDGSIAHDAEPATSVHRRLLDAEIDRLRSLVGDVRFAVRFPAPNQAALLA